MAKVTDLNGCFVRVNADIELIEQVLNVASPKMITGKLTNPLADCIYFRFGKESLVADFIPITNPRSYKEIYFHDGEFYDAPVVTKNIEPESMMVNDEIDLLGIPWTDGSIDEQEMRWSNGDKCLFNKAEAVFIGYSISHKSRCAIEYLKDNCSVIDTVFIEDISKPETETEKKTRELAEEVNRICFDLFGTPAFDCSQDIIDTVEKFVINGYKKAE